LPWVMIVLSYLIGSIPTAYIAGRVTRGRDIRLLGDNNMGAANAYRELGVRAGIIVGLIDAAKGAMVVIIAGRVDLSQIGVMASGTAAVVGHNWPVFLGFRGGKGVSTAIGILLAVITIPMLILAAPTIATLVLTRNVTRAMAVLFVPISLVCWLTGTSGQLIGYSIFLPALIGFTHLIRMKRLPAHQRT
jgi:acyl phosphate:glycerol-3-phosphate acyltransferase